MLTFDINYSQFKCAHLHLIENIFVVLSEPYSVPPDADCESNKLVNPTILTKLQFLLA